MVAPSNDQLVRTCPGLVSYSRGQQTQWALELAATPKDSMFRTVTEDYISLRDQVRDCWNAK